MMSIAADLLVRANAIRDQLLVDRSLTFEDIAKSEGVVASYASRSPTANSVVAQETAVPPNCANETPARRSRQMSREFVSARELSLLDSRKAPELAEEFARPRRQNNRNVRYLVRGGPGRTQTSNQTVMARPPRTPQWDIFD
jgi:hypothetical protein